MVDCMVSRRPPFELGIIRTLRLCTDKEGNERGGEREIKMGDRYAVGSDSLVSHVCTGMPGNEILDGTQPTARGPAG